MSDNIPFDIQANIVKRLPVKSLIQFRSVSKAWKSLIDSSRFISNYRSTVQHLLVRFKDYNDGKEKYVSIVDDHTFPQHNVSLVPPRVVSMVESSNTSFESARIIGSSHGLICFADGTVGRQLCYTRPAMAVLWNLSIRKAVGVVVPFVNGETCEITLGFGVCRDTNDPKIIKVNCWGNMEYITSFPWQAQIFSLSTEVWRSLDSNLPRKSIQLFGSQVLIDECIYWLGEDKIAIDGGFTSFNLIISFDITSEQFREVNLPDYLAHNPQTLSVAKLKNFLVVLERYPSEVVVWVMNDGDPTSFTKLYTISTPHAAVFGVLEFRKSGEPVIEIFSHGRDPMEDPSSLAVYEPDSKHIESVNIDGVCSFSYSGSSYMETLLLLDQPNNFVYDKVSDDVVCSREITIEGF